jgi:hypothetical protein
MPQKVGRADTSVPLDHLDLRLRLQFGPEPRPLRHRQIASHIRPELIDGLVLILGAPLQARPVDRDSHPFLAPGGLLDLHAQPLGHRAPSVLVVPLAPNHDEPITASPGLPAAAASYVIPPVADRRMDDDDSP